MPARLRPTAPFAADAVLVGDPGRALLLAQELLEQPKMSNHARGLWAYTGKTPAGDALTIQATGMGGPSAALVLADLAKLGVKRAVRIGTCIAADGRAEPGELLLPRTAVATKGSAASFGLEAGETVEPDAELLDRLRERLDAREIAVASLDTMPSSSGIPAGTAATDMQTVAIFARAGELGMRTAAVLIVSEAGEERLVDEILDDAAKHAGRAVAEALSNPQVET
jgi:purine-nucleoside phosphorylase